MRLKEKNTKYDCDYDENKCWLGEEDFKSTNFARNVKNPKTVTWSTEKLESLEIIAI